MPPFDIDQITDHEQQGIDRLTSKLDDKPNLLGVLVAYLEQVQQVEDVAYSLLNERMFDPDVALVPPLVPAANAQLDQYGKLVGIARNGLSDDDYRAAIRTQLLVNRSTGTVDGVLTAVGRYLDLETIFCALLQPAHIQLTIISDVALTPTQISEINGLLPRVVPAGGGWDVITFPDDLTKVFRFDTPGQGYDLGEYAGYLFVGSPP